MKSVEYKIVRFRPHLGLEEFINIGVLVYFPWLGKSEALFTKNLDKAKALHKSMDTDQWNSFLSDLTENFNHRSKTSKESMSVLFEQFIPVSESSLFLSETRQTLVPDSQDPINFVFDMFVKD